MRQSGELVAIARSLATDRAGVEVIAALARAGVPAIVLKGPTLADWLYRDGPVRTYVDADILVPPRRFADAEGVLRALGFVAFGEEEWPADPVLPHARGYARASDGAHVDLHRTLPALRAVSPDEAWSVLAARRVPVKLGGSVVDALDEGARLLLVALHAEHHADRTGKPLEDLARAIAVAEEHQWRAALRLAERLDAGPAFSAGLHRLPAGAALAERIGALPVRLAQAVGIGASTPLAAGFQRLASARGSRAKLRIVARELVPSAAFMRWCSREARSGRAGLARAYVRRWFWLVRESPASYRAWRNTRG